MKKILLVEDEAIIAMGLSFALTAAGYAVTDAADGAEGLDMARQQAPDLVVTDYMMPKMDGLSLIGQLREHGITAPVILMTGIPRENLVGCLSDPKTVYLKKPFVAPELVNTAKRLLSAARRGTTAG